MVFGMCKGNLKVDRTVIFEDVNSKLFLAESCSRTPKLNIQCF